MMRSPFKSSSRFWSFIRRIFTTLLIQRWQRNSSKGRRDYNFSNALKDQNFNSVVDTYLALPSLSQALNDSLSVGENPANLTGSMLVKYMLNRTFTDDNGGGTIYIDSNGVRRSDFTISYFTSSGNREPLLQKFGKLDEVTLQEVTRLTDWANATFPPANEPSCGYTNQKEVCRPPRNNRWIQQIIFSFVGALVIVGVALIVYIRLEHQNLCRFLGLSITKSKLDVYTVSTVTECPPRGTLRDIHSSQVTRDFAFTSSLIVDYLEALCFLHQSPLRYHGRLTPSVCWIDKHFTLKVASYGLDRLGVELCKCENMVRVSHSEPTDPLYWLTPEKPNPSDPKAMQALDVFSTGFIIYEILSNGALFNKFIALTEDDLHALVSRKGNVFHGVVQFQDFAAFESVLRSCWIADPHQRPSMQRFRSRIADISPLLTAGLSQNKLIDRMHKRLSDYSENLENLVAVRTNNLQEEMGKCDAIIGQFLPRSIVNQLRVGCDVIPELFDAVTLMFTDLSGFVDFVETNSPESTISLIDETEAYFDRLSTRCDVYKVEAVGDSYLVASGLPERIGNNHIQRLAFFAMKLMEAESQMTFIRTLRFRIGLHSGACAAGVLGLRRLRYCLFGDTVNLASRMCSHGLPGRIHVSYESKILLEGFPEYKVDCRGTQAIKGTLEMTTYWLTRFTGQI
ncbi:atrial natriuretic peptide receptor 1-like [Paramacrobiotus metropolitanus]|uniref:atrial natriuretic peptide receptor 1-like n=1 Tax=Paramacrobiotus metropolitanus TaxID=2943436 RepID=UPI002445600C|nr:atrial natriuretic peptide receptor 1-like [Paramacrobiotus metropolitanus]